MNGPHSRQQSSPLAIGAQAVFPDQARMTCLPSRFEGVDSYEIITQPAAMFALQREWQELCARSTGHYLGQTFDWARISWETVARPRGRRLLCLVARRDGRVGLIWPLVTRQGWTGSVARPLDSETSEYGMALVEDCADAERRVAAAWKVLRDNCGCDRLELENVRSDSVLGRVLSDPAAPRAGFPQFVTSQDAPWVSWDGIDSWDSYLRRLDGAQRRQLGRKSKRLAEVGEICFEPVTDAAERDTLLDWMLAHKRAWLQKSRLHNGWFFSREYRAFLTASMSAFAPSGRRIIFALKLNGRAIAAQLSSVDHARVEWFIGAFDPEYGKYSPGQLLHERCLRWAFERGLDYDFRIGSEPAKFFWSNRVGQATNYVFANSARGAIYVLARKTRLMVAQYRARVTSQWR
jgi:CelD/BcsL family acetyltransferase involved in cellulose biosynthesis